jgi:hypothetical protein
VARSRQSGDKILWGTDFGSRSRIFTDLVDA